VAVLACLHLGTLVPRGRDVRPWSGQGGSLEALDKGGRGRLVDHAALRRNGSASRLDGEAQRPDRPVEVAMTARQTAPPSYRDAVTSEDERREMTLKQSKKKAACKVRPLGGRWF